MRGIVTGPIWIALNLKALMVKKTRIGIANKQKILRPIIKYCLYINLFLINIQIEHVRKTGTIKYDGP